MRPFALLITLLLTACTVPFGLMPTPEPLPDLQPALALAVAYLESEYDPAVGLLRESPITAPDRYWLATDNQLAIYALDAVNSPLAATLTETIVRYKDRPHGLIEALVGDRTEWPPRVEIQRQVDGKIWNEDRLFGVQYEDWEEYADLTLYGALVAHNQGDADEAQKRYQRALSMFDGVGFADKAYTSPDGHGLYATYKLALALYVVNRIGEPSPRAMLDALLSKQALSGGFTTLYNEEGAPQGDTNTETTSYALLALKGVVYARNHSSSTHQPVAYGVRTDTITRAAAPAAYTDARVRPATGH